MTTINLPPSLAMSDNDEAEDYGQDGDDNKDEERRSGDTSRGGGGGGGGGAIHNWHLHDVSAWKAKRALIRKRKEKEAGRGQRDGAKAGADAAGPKQDK